MTSSFLLSFCCGQGGGWTGITTPDSFKDITVDCDVNEEFNNLDVPIPLPFAEWNWFATSWVENIRLREHGGGEITGGEGAFTQWVWVELIESTETICPANTHQVHAEFI